MKTFPPPVKRQAPERSAGHARSTDPGQYRKHRLFFVVAKRILAPRSAFWPALDRVVRLTGPFPRDTHYHKIVRLPHPIACVALVMEANNGYRNCKVV